MLDADRAARLSKGTNHPKAEEPKKKSECKVMASWDRCLLFGCCFFPLSSQPKEHLLSC